MNPSIDMLDHQNEDQKINELQHIVEATIDERAKQQIIQILDKISMLKPHERLLLYLRMPSSSSKSDPLKQSQNPLGTRSEINHTINWVKTHLEHDPNVSIPKQDVYEDYELYCNQVNIKPLSTADFGKVMKQIFPDIRPRRLGTRGNSRYCYAALRKTTKLDSPQLPNIIKSNNLKNIPSESDDDASNVVKKWAEQFFNIEFASMKELASYILTNNWKSTESSNVKTMLPKDLRTKAKISESNSLKKRKKKKQKKQFLPLSMEKSTVTTNLLNVNQPRYSGGPVMSKIPELLLVKNASLFDNHLADITPKLEPDTFPTKLIDSFENENEIPEQDHSTIVCKKVKQAQQSKSTLISTSFIPTAKIEPMISSTTVHSDLDLMKPPDNKIDILRSTSQMSYQMSSSDKCINPPTAPKRMCKVMQRPQNPMVPVKTEDNLEDDIPTDIIIPRERVISICSLDKDALDDYLIEENNSQEQEAELLKYFHNDGDNSNSNDHSIVVRPNEEAQFTGSSNYNNFKTKIEVDKNFDEISELRQCLQQSLKPNNADVKNARPNLKMDNYAQMSEPESSRRKAPSDNPSRESRRKTSTTTKSTKNIPQSPNTRRKNFTFVPISPGPISPRVCFNFNQHEPNSRKPTTKMVQYQSHYDTSRQYARMSNYASADNQFGRIKEDISFSAPSSPLLPLRNMNIVGNKYNSPGGSYPLPQNEFIGNRSQSVPLHCQSPAFEHSAKYDSHTVCNSIVQTPVPPEFADFSDDHFLSILAESSVDTQIKIEANPVTSEIMPLNNNYSVDLSAIFPTSTNSNTSNYYSSSRSVPSTPQPVLTLNTRKVNSIDNSKSVPTTPINLTHSSFRYSPEQGRDFLINGNTIDPCLTTHFYGQTQSSQSQHHQQQQHHHHQHHHHQQQQQQQENHGTFDADKTKRYSDDIEELTSFGEAADPIVGTDLLNSL